MVNRQPSVPLPRCVGDSYAWQMSHHVSEQRYMRVLAAMIHWTRQIKEVLSAQDAVQTSENAGPLEEIEFWKNRCADLSGITTQLDKPGVKRITSLLQLAKSSYVAPFLKLSSQIKVRRVPCFRLILLLFYCSS